jgi:hypothetical protein
MPGVWWWSSVAAERRGRAGTGDTALSATALGLPGRTNRVPLSGGHAGEANETFTLPLYGAANTTPGASSSTTGRIQDSDRPW